MLNFFILKYLCIKKIPQLLLIQTESAIWQGWKTDERKVASKEDAEKTRGDGS